MAKAKFRIGDHVRYVGDIRKASWINETAIIADISNSGEYKVEWDRPGITNTGYGWGIRESSLEPVVDWSAPLELNDGTPIVLAGQPGTFHADIRTLGGRSHPAFPTSPTWRGSARLNNGLVISNHAYFVRNRTMSSIDTKRQLILHSPAHGDGLADFITETSEGHILISAKDRTFNWAIFTTSGDFVRSSDGSGQSLKLRNEPRTVEQYLFLDSQGRSTGRSAVRQTVGSNQAQIKLTYVDGILQAAEIVDINKEPINVG